LGRVFTARGFGNGKVKVNTKFLYSKNSSQLLQQVAIRVALFLGLSEPELKEM
jgi:hypothetical protein